MKRQRKSKNVRVTLVTAMALAVTACGVAQTDKVCVDKDQVVVDGKKCEDDEKDQQARSGYTPFYHWYYMSRAGTKPGIYAPGSHVAGGSFEAPHVSSTISRGGFGSIGSGHSVSS